MCLGLVKAENAVFGVKNAYGSCGIIEERMIFLLVFLDFGVFFQVFVVFCIIWEMEKLLNGRSYVKLGSGFLGSRTHSGYCGGMEKRAFRR